MEHKIMMPQDHRWSQGATGAHTGATGQDGLMERTEHMVRSTRFTEPQVHRSNRTRAREQQAKMEFTWNNRNSEFTGSNRSTRSHRCTGATGAGSNGATGATGQDGSDGNFGGATYDYTYNGHSGSTPQFSPLLQGDALLGGTTSVQKDATFLQIAKSDDQNNSIDEFISTFTNITGNIKGHIRLSAKGDDNKFLMFTISTITEQTSSNSWIIIVDNVGFSGSDPFANNQDLLISFTMAGPTGSTGPVVQGNTDGQILVWRDTDNDNTPDSWVAEANDGVDDADASVTNELSDLSISGNTLSLTNPLTSGNSVTIPTELPTSGTDNDVLTWDATSNSWVAQEMMG